MVRTRFAPSPTGYLHIGGVRTALFCWLFARRHGGQFILRIDDTDQERNVEEALEPILRGLRWLGLDWDEGPEVGGPHAPYYQSQRSARHQAAVEELLKRGAAYRDYATPEEIRAEREAAEREKRDFRYSRRWMAETAADRARFEAQSRKPVVRLKMPQQGTLVIEDLVRGRVEVEWAREPAGEVERLGFAGIHVIEPAIFPRMTETGAFPITRIYLRLAGEGERIVAYRADGCYWQDIGSPEKLEETRKRGAGEGEGGRP